MHRAQQLWVAAWIALGGLFVLGGCGDDNSTGILLDISVDKALEIPTDYDTLQIVARTDDGSETTGLLSWSKDDDSDNLRANGTFGIKPGSKKDATVEVLGYIFRRSDNAVRAIKRVRAKFVPGKIVKVPFNFEGACADMLCCTLGADPTDSPCFTDATPDCRTPTAGGDAMCFPTEECRESNECDDDNPATADSCENGVCVNGADDDASTESDAGDAG